MPTEDLFRRTKRGGFKKNILEQIEMDKLLKNESESEKFYISDREKKV